MDSERFDRLTRSFSSRRAALGGLAAAVAHLLAGPPQTAAQPRTPCRHPGQACIPERELACCAGARCRDGRCVRPKRTAACRPHCRGGAVCREGRCRCPGRTKRCGRRCIPRAACCRGHCGPGQVCEAGRCRPAPPPCEGVVCPPCQQCDPATGTCVACEFCCDGVTCCPPGTVQCCVNPCMPCLVAPFNLPQAQICGLPFRPDQCQP